MTDATELTARIMRETRIAVLTYLDEQGRLVSTPMGTQDFDDPSTVWFITKLDTDKVHAIERNPEVNVHYSSEEGWVSLTGTARVNPDPAKLAQLWDSSTEMYMTGGPTDPDNGLLEVSATTASYWEKPGNASSVLAGLTSIFGSDDQATEPDNGIVNLDN